MVTGSPVATTACTNSEAGRACRPTRDATLTFLSGIGFSYSNLWSPWVVEALTGRFAWLLPGPGFTGFGWVVLDLSESATRSGP